MVSFDNTEIAFAGKSNGDLKRASLLFNLIGNKLLVDVGEFATPLALQFRLPIRGLVKRTIFRQFVGGETVAECKDVIQYLAEKNTGTILDYSVEGKEDEHSFEMTFHELLNNINKGGTEKHIPFSVFKVTGIARSSLLEMVSQGKKLSDAEQEEWSLLASRVDQLCKAANEKGLMILIDAEESWFQTAIDQLATAMMEKYNQSRPVVFNTLQMYRHDRLEFLRKSISEAAAKNYFAGFKIVRGAYMEKERERAAKMGLASPIQPNKEATDRDYDAALDICMNHIEKVALCAGTHNEKSNYALMEMMKKRQVPNNHPHIWFSQLLGMSDHISFNLAADSYLVAKYVPYGPVEEVLPYLIRRAKENTSVAGQTGRELSLIRKELKRRNAKPSM